jgi:hypothetical protein
MLHARASSVTPVSTGGHMPASIPNAGPSSMTQAPPIVTTTIVSTARSQTPNLNAGPARLPQQQQPVPIAHEDTVGEPTEDTAMEGTSSKYPTRDRVGSFISTSGEHRYFKFNLKREWGSSSASGFDLA